MAATSGKRTFKTIAFANIARARHSAVRLPVLRESVFRGSTMDAGLAEVLNWGGYVVAALIFIFVGLLFWKSDSDDI